MAKLEKSEELVSLDQQNAAFACDCLERVVHARCEELLHEIKALCADGPRFGTKLVLPKRRYTALQADAAVRRWCSEVERRIAGFESEDGMSTTVTWSRWFVETGEGKHYTYRVLVGMVLPESEDEAVLQWYQDAAEGAARDLLDGKSRLRVTSLFANELIYDEVRQFVERSGLTRLDLNRPATWH